MDIERMISLASRLFFVGAFVLLSIALIERAANAMGYTVLEGAFTGGRMLEIAAILLIFVIAMQVRGIREELRKQSS
jgi:hypothetical protein